MLHLVKTSNRNAYFRSLFSQIWIHSLDKLNSLKTRF